MTKLPKTYYDFKNCNTKIQVHQGGTRSGKTYSIIQGLIEFAYVNKNAGAVISICRKTSPSLVATVYRDFVNILQSEGIYDESLQTKKPLEYKLFGNLVEFFSIDDSVKVRGRQRDVLFVNEANELFLEDWRQLTLRTSYKIIIDYNPSDEYHWIYNEVIPRSDATFFKTTYLDNPFLPESIIKEIEQYKDIDENYWKVYGLGERGASGATIFTKYEMITDYNDIKLEEVFGVDFGYNHETAICGVKIDSDNKKIYTKQYLYERFLTSADIIDRIKDINEISNSSRLICDSARPEIIQVIEDEGFNAENADKGKNSVHDSILNIKKHNLFIDKGSSDLLKEIRGYKWKVDKNGQVLDEPVKVNDHLMDALRYATFTEEDSFTYVSV